MRTILYFLFFIGGYYTYFGDLTASVRTCPRLPLEHRQTGFKAIKKMFEEREKKFLGNREHQQWTMEREEKEILKEFDQVNDWRHHIWYKDPSADTLESREEFMIAQDLLAANRFRYSFLIAFQYNRTDCTYNSSTIILNGRKFLALEAPSADSITRFFNLLHNYSVTHLVRLTPAYEKDGEKSYPYWEKNTEIDSQTKEAFLNVPLQSHNKKDPPYKIRYYAVDTWLNDEGFKPKEFLSFIQEVNKNSTPDSLIAVHCHAGVSRTGTFIAGLLLIDEINRQISKGIPPSRLKISVEKVVKQLSLQRFLPVAIAEQYLTLYRLVDLYVNDLQTRRELKSTCLSEK